MTQLTMTGSDWLSDRDRRQQARTDASTRFDPIDLLAGLMFADANETHQLASGGMRKTSDGMVHEEIDAGTRLEFQAMNPRRAHTLDMLDGERIFAVHPDYLLRHPAETLGREAEVVILKHDRLAWIGFRRLNKAPKHLWVASSRAVLYEAHYREVFPDGRSFYNKRVAAVDRNGAAVPCLIVGSSGRDSRADGFQLVMAASIIEDCHRSRSIRCELTDHNTIIAPIPLGAQMKLFALRDGPLTGRGRRRAILHHVMRHRRKSSAGNEHEVQEHFRGATSFEVDGLRVTLTANDEDAR